MGFFDKIKASVGIGGAKVEVQLAPGAVAPGGFIRGKIHLRAGKLEQKCNGLVVGLERQVWVTEIVDGHEQESAEHDTIYSEDLAPYEQDVEPGEEMEWEFTIQLPSDATIGGKTSYEVTAEADIPGAIDPSHSVKVPVGQASAPTVDDIPTLLEVAHSLYGESDRMAEQEKALRQILTLQPDHPEALKLLAQALGFADRQVEAAEVWARYTQVAPSDVEGWLERSRCARERQAHTEVVQFSAQATQIAPRRPDLWRLRAQALEALGQHADALSAWDQALAGEEPGQEIYLGKARLQTQMGEQSAAIQTYQAAAGLEDQSETSEIVEDLDKLGYPEIADECLERAIAVDPEDWSNMQHKAERKLKQDKHRECLQVADQTLHILDIPYFRSDVWDLKGQAFQALGQTDQARTAFERALEENAENEQALKHLAQLG